MPVLKTSGAYGTDAIARTKCIRCYDSEQSGQQSEKNMWRDADGFNAKLRVLGHIVALAPEVSVQGVATLFGFKISRLPRDANRWEPDSEIQALTFYVAADQPRPLQFREAPKGRL
jgi:hypothetical protein